MKKVFLSLALIATVSLNTYAYNIEVEFTTSCGTRYSLQCNSCSNQAIMNAALALEERDC